MGDFSNYKKFENVGIRSSNDTLIVMDSTNNNISLHSSDGGGTNVDTLSIKNIINKTPNMDLNLSSLNGTKINPVITINNNNSDCRIMTNLNISGNLNITENLHISNQINSTVSTGTPPFSVNSTTTVPNLKAATAVVADSAISIEGSAVSGVFKSSFETWINSGTSLTNTVPLSPYNPIRTTYDTFQEQKFPSGLIMRFGKIYAYHSNVGSPYEVKFGPSMTKIFNIHVQGTDGHHFQARNYGAVTVNLNANNNSFIIYWNNVLDYIFWMVIGK